MPMLIDFTRKTTTPARQSLHASLCSDLADNKFNRLKKFKKSTIRLFFHTLDPFMFAAIVRARVRNLQRTVSF